MNLQCVNFNIAVCSADADKSHEGGEQNVKERGRANYEKLL